MDDDTATSEAATPEAAATSVDAAADVQPSVVTDPLLTDVRAIEDLPVGERAAAFERLNRSLVGALNQLEQL